MKTTLTIVLSAALSVAFAEENANLGTGALGYATNCHRTVSVGTRAGYMSSNVFDSVIIGDHALFKGAFVDGVVAIGAEEFSGAKLLQNTTSINGHQVWVSEPLRAFCISTERGGALTNAPLYLWRGTLHLNATNIVMKNGSPIAGIESVTNIVMNHVKLEDNTLTVGSSSTVLVKPMSTGSGWAEGADRANYADGSGSAFSAISANSLIDDSEEEYVYYDYESHLPYVKQGSNKVARPVVTCEPNMVLSFGVQGNYLTVSLVGQDGNIIELGRVLLTQ